MVLVLFLTAVAGATAGTGLPGILRQPHVFFTTSHAQSGVLGATAYGTAAGEHATTPFACQMVDFAGGKGVCLKTVKSKVSPYVGFAFDSDLHQLLRFKLQGNPLSVRVRGDGLIASYTIGAYVDRDENTGGPGLTRVFFLELSTGKVLQLDLFTVLGLPKRAVGIRLFANVAFDPTHLNRFYAEMSEGTKRYLVRGDWTRHTVSVVLRNALVPSVSPDGTRLSYLRIGKHPRLMVLNLATGRSTAVNETREVEDQAAWLDDSTLLYPVEAKVGDDLWTARADGSGKPRLFLRSATSPSVVVG